MKVEQSKLTKYFLPAAFLAVGAACRIALYHVAFPDYEQFFYPWIETLRAYGPTAISSGFAAYNTPILLLLWLFSLFTPYNLLALKLLAFVFEVIMALGAMKVVGHLRPGGYLKYTAGALTLILPTVVMIGPAWGQVDAIHGAILVWALYFCLKDRLHTAWFFAGMAIAVKLPAAFFFPFLLALSFNRKKARLTGPAFMAGGIALLSCPTLFMGDSFSRIVSGIVSGSGNMLGIENIAWWASTLWQWFPGGDYAAERVAGVVLAAIFAFGIILYGIRSERFGDEKLLLLAAFCLLVLPFVLPQMHNRYYYIGEICVYLLAFAKPRAAYCVFVTQALTVSTIWVALAGAPSLHWSFRLISLGMVFVLAMLGRWLALHDKNGHVTIDP